MSAVMGLSSDPDRMCKNSITQWRHNSSGEIDVFEAARYFSGGGDIQYPNQNVPPGQRVLACRISLEMPNINNQYSNNLAAQNDQKQMQEKKKYKQPSSPGGKLASFLNSLFNQTTTASKKTTTKKKKNVLYKSGSSKNDLEEERKRRSSISHFRITTNHDSNANTTTPPTKSTLRSLSHHQIEVGVSAPSRSNTTNGGGIDQKRITSGNDINYKNNCGSSLGFSDRSSTMNYYYWGDHDDRQSEFNTRKFNDDGADSDSSSDLFDLDFCSSSTGNLPVYGTTHVDRIRIHSAATISAVSTIL